MAARQPIPTSSRRPRESTQGEMAIGSFRRLEEIGRGSFATVYKAAYSVSLYPDDSIVLLIVDFGSRLHDFYTKFRSKKRGR